MSLKKALRRKFSTECMNNIVSWLGRSLDRLVDAPEQTLLNSDLPFYAYCLVF